MLWGRTMTPEPPSATRAEPAAQSATMDGVGWKLGTFALERLMPDEAMAASVTLVWAAYRGWCREGGCEPLALPIFVSEFDRLAAEVGMARQQHGANVVYPGMRIKEAR